MKQANKKLIYVRLRAGGYSIAETARLLEVTLAEAWDIERTQKQEIDLEAGVLELKRIKQK